MFNGIKGDIYHGQLVITDIFSQPFSMVYMVFPAVLAALLQLRRLVDLVDQFAIVLTAMPFVSVETKAKAIASLKGFNADDVKKARLEKRNVKNEKSLEDFSEDIFLKIGGFFIDVY